MSTRVKASTTQLLAISRGQLTQVIARFEADPELWPAVDDLNTAIDHITSVMKWLQANPQLGR